MANKPGITDSVVIYHSEEDGCWIAHSLRTDQIGTGESVLRALEDVMRAVDAVAEAAQNDPSIRLYRDAPANIIAIRETAQKLPAEIYEIACKRVHGKWPAQLEANVDSSDESGPFFADPPTKELEPA